MKAKAKAKLFAKLIDSEGKAELLTLFHKEPDLADTVEGFAKRLGRSPEETKEDLEALRELGLVRRLETYRFVNERDEEVQRSISLELDEEASLNGRRVMPCGQAGKTGVAVIDALLEGSYPFSSAVVVSGEAGGGKTMLCQGFLGESLERGSTGIYVALDDFPDNVRKALRAAGYDVERFEAEGRLVFIDSYSCQIGLESHERYLCDSQELSILSITITTALTEQGREGATTIVLDSFTSLLQKCGVKPSLEFLRVLVAKTRGFKADLWVKLNNRAFHPAIVAAVYDMVDGVIELRREESAEGLRNMLRVSKMRGALHKTAWTPYELHPAKGLVPRRIEPRSDLLPEKAI
ncbi:MAG: RAD55 family ATPase [Candidatus Bathyarchaeia archaeon]